MAACRSAGIWFVLLGFATACSAPAADRMAASPDPAIASLIAQVSETEILDTAEALQDLRSRAWGQPGNRMAAAYLHGRFSAMPGLAVEYQGGALSNVVATLSGSDPSLAGVYVVGAHYDSTSSVITNSPGATDDAAGVGVVLEYARLMSRAKFRHTVIFGCWNREEVDLAGSSDFASHAMSNGLTVSLYVNNDSCCFDPENRYVLDIIYNDMSAHAKDLMAEHNLLYGVGFKDLGYNVHKCGGDYGSFWKNNLPAVSTHQEVHGAFYHKPSDTADKINARYAKMNAQLGMSVVARLAEIR